MGFGEVRRQETVLLVLDSDDGELPREWLPPHPGGLHADSLEPVGHALLALHEASAVSRAVRVDAGADVRETSRLEEGAVCEVKFRGDQDAILTQKLGNKVVVRHEQSPLRAGTSVRERQTVPEECPRAGPRSHRKPEPALTRPSTLLDGT